MELARRILSWILLASVVVALGDAPYVDELFDALAPSNAQIHDAAQSPDTPHERPGNIDTSRALWIYQALAALITAPQVAAVPADVLPNGYVASPPHKAASPDPSRIDRPPAPLAA